MEYDYTRMADVTTDMADTKQIAHIVILSCPLGSKLLGFKAVYKCYLIQTRTKAYRSESHEVAR